MKLSPTSLMSGFDSQSRLLLEVLMSGPGGAVRALTVFRRQQRAKPGHSADNLIQTLCRDEIISQTDKKGLEIKPLVCLFPSSFKQNLLSFINMVHSCLSWPSIPRLLKCLLEETDPNPWVTVLTESLQRQQGYHHQQPLHTEACAQRLNELSSRLVGFTALGGWARCFTREEDGTNEIIRLGTQRKRKKSLVYVDSDSEETGQHSKRIKIDIDGDECVKEGELVFVMKPAVCESRPEGSSPSVNISDVLPEPMMASCLQIKELLESQTEWDESAADVFKVLNECDSHQVELFCKLLNLHELPESALPRLCNTLSSLSPHLSCSTAATLIKHLLLEKTLRLSEPASRCLVLAATSLCSHYARAMCSALIEPMLNEKIIGNPQVELLNKLVESCLEPHYKLLVLLFTLKVKWSEPVLSVIHSLLDSAPVLNEDVFTQFVEQLVKQGPVFITSVKFAKMMLTVLNKYSNFVTLAHKHSLSNCLMNNATFLKKSLQAALKRITYV